VGRKKHKFNRICQVAPMCPHGRAHWRHLANAIEPFVCGGDAVLCQITLTTCYYICKKLISLKHCVRSQITRLKLQKLFCDLEHVAPL